MSLSLETAAFEKGSKRAENRMSGFQKNMQRTSNAVKTAFVGMLGVFAVDQLVSVAKAGLEYASSLGEVASQLGVTTKALQEYRYAATQAGIDQGEMDQALAQLTKRLGAAANGAKAPTAALEKLGVSLRDANGRVIDAGEAIPLIAEGLKGLASPAERAAVLVDLFGKAGQKLAPLLEGGAAGVNNLRNAAHELGIVLSDEQIQKADDTADKLAAMKQVLEARIAGAVADNADAILALVDALVKLVSAAGNAVSAWNKWRNAVGGANAMDENQRIRSANRGDTVNGSFLGFQSRTLGTRGAWLPSGEGPLGTTRRFRPGLPKGGRGGGGGSRALGSTISLGQSPGAFATKAAEGGLVRMAQAANDVDKPIASVGRNLSGIASTSAPKASEAFKKMKAELEDLRRTTQGIFDRLFPKEADARTYAEEIATLDSALAKGQITAENHSRAILALRREYQEFGAAMSEAVEIMRVDFAPSLDDVSEKIADSLPDALGKLPDHAKFTTVRVAQTFKDMANDILGSLNQLSNSIRGGGFLDILTGVVGLGLQLGGAGLFGKKVAANINRVPAFANGTNFAPGGLALVGERGPELVNLPRGSRVTPNNELGGMGGIAQIVPSPYFDVVVDGRVMRAAPGIASAGASGGLAQMRRSGQRRVA